MSQPVTRSDAQSPVPRAWSSSAPLPNKKEKPFCNRCHFETIEEVIKLRFNNQNHFFCSKNCLKMWVFQVIK